MTTASTSNRLFSWSQTCLFCHIEDFLAVSGVTFPSEDWSLVLAKDLQAVSNLMEINHLCVVLLTVPVSQDNKCDVQQTSRVPNDQYCCCTPSNSAEVWTVSEFILSVY